ncbi:MAG: CARDB domain-containing protein, partial [Stellaceae bacterium]
PPPPPPPPRSDLLPGSIKLGSTSVAPGASLLVSWLLANQGLGAASSTSTEVLRINQSSSSDSGANLAVVSPAALAPGASIQQSFALTAPTVPGTYFVWVVADGAQHSMAFTVSPPPPPVPGSAAAAGGSANRGVDRYVISGAIGGGWKWRRAPEKTAGNQGYVPASVQSAETGAGGSHFLGSLNRFTSRVHTLLKTVNVPGIANRGHGPRALRSVNRAATDGGRRAK